MYNVKRLVALVLAIVALGTSARDTQAGMIGLPLPLRGVIEKIRFSEPTLAPMAYTMFCMRYSDECKQKPRARMVFRGGAMRLTKQRIADLIEVNASVNRQITPQRNERGLADEEWLINPARGDCNDYAVSKRHELLARGWPMRNLLLSEVVTSWGEHHLVLVVRAKGGDIVLDNLNAQIRNWSQAHYRWVRMQTPANPDHWAAVAQLGA
ncbi:MULTISPECIES: transglutaminase-like cysteine peptidase [unclassified Bradyrhizobium]|uniref:transglutaminase-like cysteine peptidase n=1 Tax=unclassified Bradyrhizobium TaxID=2631580 RepID=UPI0003FA9551|nr:MULTISPECIES: transglutaminase-like cysteine peptidase [unclassified Bradyrhizobium]QIG98779.1 transglutaminase-like cysteine peptidase [Bradyrhizobium sp. 6(2017)]